MCILCCAVGSVKAMRKENSQLHDKIKVGCTFKDVLQRNNIGVLDSENSQTEIIRNLVFFFKFILFFLNKSHFTKHQTFIFNWSPDGILAA